MLSIIICSISPGRLQDVLQSIKETIGAGTDYEVIAIDNRERNWPIAKVYNYGAGQAKYPYLFFVHEDVKFHSQGWGEFVELKLAEPDCGVIGFAGSKVRVNAYSGWGQLHTWVRSCYYQRSGDCIGLEFVGVSWDCPFEEVVVLDGFAMFVRKVVWEQNVFDEEMLTGFHCYDLDFSLQIARNYKNYVCCSSLVLIEHFSNGCYDAKWISETIRMHEVKWQYFLPMMVSGLELPEKIIKKNNERVLNSFLFLALRTNTSDADRRKLLLKFLRMPFSWKHLSHCFSCTLKYVRTLLTAS